MHHTHKLERPQLREYTAQQPGNPRRVHQKVQPQEEEVLLHHVLALSCRHATGPALHDDDKVGGVEEEDVVDEADEKWNQGHVDDGGYVGMTNILEVGLDDPSLGHEGRELEHAGPDGPQDGHAPGAGRVDEELAVIARVFRRVRRRPPQARDGQGHVVAHNQLPEHRRDGEEHEGQTEDGVPSAGQGFVAEHEVRHCAEDEADDHLDAAEDGHQTVEDALAHIRGEEVEDDDHEVGEDVDHVGEDDDVGAPEF